GDSRADEGLCRVRSDTGYARRRKLAELRTPRIMRVLSQRPLEPYSESGLLRLIGLDEQRVGRSGNRPHGRKHGKPWPVAVEELIDHTGDEPVAQLFTEQIRYLVVSADKPQ